LLLNNPSTIYGMELEKLIHSIFNYQRIGHRDKFTRVLKYALLKFCIFLLGLVGLYYYAAAPVNHPYFSYWLLVWGSFNAWAIFYDMSLSLQTSLFSKYGFKEVKFAQLRTYAMRIGLSSDGEPENHEKFHRDLPNIMFFQNLITKKVIATMGVELKASAMHVNPNYGDFFRKLYDVMSAIPITVQVELKKMGHSAMNKKSNALETTLFGDGMGPLKKSISNFEDHIEFKYQIFFSSHINSLNRTQVSRLIFLMQKITLEIQHIIDVNFAHFKFGILEGMPLLNAVRGAITGKPFENEGSLDKIMIDTNSSLGEPPVIRFWFKPLIVCLVNFMICYSLSQTLGDDDFFLGTFSFLVLIVGVIMGIKHYLSDNFFYLNKYNPTTSAINLFPSGKFVVPANIGRLDSPHALFYYDIADQVFYCQKFYSIKYLNRSFRFNQVKWYRALMGRVTGNNYSINLQTFAHRVLPWRVENFRASLKDQFWSYWQENPEKHNTISRNICGFYQFQPVFQVTLRKELELRSENRDQILAMSQRVDEVFIPLLRSGFPHCGIEKLSKNTIIQSLLKSRSFSKFGTGSPMNFTSGTILGEMIVIPDEIHKYLPTNYPGEFSVPFLEDNLDFGWAFNPENNKKESRGGLSMEEIQNGIIFTGQNYSDYHKGTMRFAGELLKNRVPLIIFDWDGTWKHMVNMLDEHNAKHNIRFFEAGKNIGLNLVNLPYGKQGPIYISYIQQLCRVIEQIFHWKEGDVSLLRTHWLNINRENKNHKKNLTIKNIADAIHESLKEKQTHRLFSNPVYSQLLVWGQEHLNNAFSGVLESQCDLEYLFDRKSTLIISVESLKDPQIKCLFIQALLYQILALREYETLGLSESKFPMGSKVIFWPEMEKQFSRARAHNDSANVDSLLMDLRKQGYPMVTETSLISDVYPSVLAFFETYYTFRIDNEYAMKVLVHKLNLDEVFTNILSHASRKVSYQFPFLKSMPEDMCLVYRPQYKIPYPFIFDYKATFSREKVILTNHRTYTDLGVNIPAVNTQDISEENDPRSTALEIDFEQENIVLEELYSFLENCHDFEQTVGYCAYREMKDMLFETLDIPLRDRMEYNSGQCHAYVDQMIKKLIDLSYFERITKKSDAGLEIEGYILTEKSKDVIQKWKKYQDLNRFEQEEEYLIEEEFPEVPDFQEETPAEMNNSVGNQKKSTEDFFRDEFSSTSIRNRYDAPEWLEVTRGTLPEVVLDAKSTYARENYEACQEQLQNGLGQLLKTLDINRSQEDDALENVYSQLDGYYRQIMGLKASDTNQLGLVLTQLRKYMVEI
jgi:hypothetical protein